MSQDYTALRNRCGELLTTLREITPQLALYDRERSYSKVESLLREISLKEASANGTTKRFRFQKKISLKKNIPPAETAARSFRDKPALRTGEIISIQSSISSCENLDQCTLTSDPDMDYNERGSIILRNVSNGLVKLQPLPFSTGSVFITDCDNLTIVCSTPSRNAAQIRLRNLNNCRIFILPHDTDCKQVVVLENCVGCVFHKSTEHLLSLQNFSALAEGKSTKERDTNDTQAYKFDLFDESQSAHQLV